MSDSEVDDLERFRAQKEQELYGKAGFQDQEASEPEFSDEEVMALQSDGQEDYYSNPELSDAGEGWGKSKANYYGDDDYQEDSEAQEEEEEEALRIQQRQTAELDENDFYDEDDIEGWKKDANSQLIEIEEMQNQDLSQMTATERLSFLQDSYPEVALFTKELHTLKHAAEQLENVEGEVAKFQKVALRGYMGMIYAYFALFNDKIQDGLVDLKEHPIMEGILKARELWRVASQASGLQEPYEDDDEELLSANGSEISLSQSDADSQADEEVQSESQSESDRQSSDESEEEEEEEDEFAVSLPSIQKKKVRNIGDYDEAADSVEQAARYKNRQSLKFYTTQISKKAAKQSENLQGDADLPYKERHFERRQRLMREAYERGQQQKDKLGESDPEPEAEQSSNSNDYYAAALKARESKKETLKHDKSEAEKAAKQGKLDEYLAANPQVDKRAINYQILKNKGLTPWRKKENRNARVKKRVRYEAAQKKLRSIRGHHREQSGAYGGELSGIRKDVVHSTRFRE